ncbi:hypothetical protein GCM10010404_22220 [Nonomuraea africana]|uniref:Glycosyltransferase RgtA/B/C/D-like domain-containing protein n=1 Tax=Nonomuraea africana TaxID=46171 RepID=A0ABR9KUR9_9ACTN|nr:hypothetical protein [Nonomuraea africana]MBE1565481.1 hypothetical protein [Nonomuraea africana]
MAVTLRRIDEASVTPTRWRKMMPRGRRRMPVVVFTACMSVYAIWWAACYPGLMSWDSVTIVWQVTSGSWRADHSVLYNALVWASIATTGDLAALTLTQGALAAATLSLMAVAIRDLGVPGRWCAAAAVVVAALPATGTFVVTVWKDVPFALCLVAMTATVALLVRRRRSTALAVGLAAETLALVLLRNNAFVFVLIGFVIVVVLLPGARVRVALAGAVPVSLSFLASAFVYPAMGIEPVRPWLTYATAYSDIAVTYAARPEIFGAKELDLMRRVAPLEHWRDNATCYNADPTLSRGFDVARSDRLHRELVGLWADLLKRVPAEVAGARLCRGSVAWKVFPEVPEERLLIGWSRVPDDLFGWSMGGKPFPEGRNRDILTTRPLSDTLHNVAAFARDVTYTRQVEWIFWRGATWCYVAYAAVIAAAWATRRPALLALAGIVAGQQLGVMLAIPAQLFRYMAAPMMVGMMLVPLLVAALAGRLRGREAS